MATITAAAGGGNWTTGGTWVGGIAPTAADDVLLTATSGNVTIVTGSLARSINCTGYVGTLTHTASVVCQIGDGTAGLTNVALLLVAGMTYTRGNTASQFTFQTSAATTQTVDSGGKALGALSFAGTGSTLQLASALNAQALTHSTGTLDTNGQTCNWVSYTTSSATATLTLGASAVSSTNWTFANATLNAGTSTITVSATGTTVAGGGKTYNNMVITAANVPNITGANTFANLTRTGTATKTDALGISATQTITGTLTLTGNSVTNRLLVQSNSFGTQRTFNAANVTATNVDFQDINATGAANWNLSASTGLSGDAGGNTGITFTTPAAQTFQGTASGSWSDVTKWTSRVPLPQDDVAVSSAFVAGRTVTVDMPRIGKNISFAGTTGAPALAIGSISFTWFGNFTLASGMTTTGSSSFTGTCAARTSVSFASAAVIWRSNLECNARGSTMTLTDSVTTAGSNVTTTLTSGTLDATAASQFWIAFASNNTNTRTLKIVDLTCGGTQSSSWNISSATGLTLVHTGTIFCNPGATSTTTFVSPPLAGYNNLAVTGGSGGIFRPSGGLTFNTLTLAAGASGRFQFTNSTTLTVTNFVAVGTAGNLITIDTNGGTATLSKTSGTVVCDYISLTNSIAAGGATFYAGSHSTNVSGNTGWIFTDPPAKPNLLLMGVG